MPERNVPRHMQFPAVSNKEKLVEVFPRKLGQDSSAIYLERTYY
jgi:hypothetical protein